MGLLDFIKKKELLEIDSLKDEIAELQSQIREEKIIIDELRQQIFKIEELDKQLEDSRSGMLAEIMNVMEREKDLRVAVEKVKNENILLRDLLGLKTSSS